MKQTIDMRPAPGLIRAALAHCEVPLTYNDDHTVSIPAGPGFDSNGMMTIPEDHVLREILSALLTVAMEKHILDTMVMPSNADRLRRVARNCEEFRATVPAHDTDELVDEIVFSINEVADNIDPAKQS